MSKLAPQPRTPESPESSAVKVLSGSVPSPTQVTPRLTSKRDDICGAGGNFKVSSAGSRTLPLSPLLTSSSVSISAAEKFLEYDEMIRKTMEATKRMNRLRESLVESRTSDPKSPRKAFGDDVDLPHYNYNYAAPLERRRLKTPAAWKEDVTAIPMTSRDTTLQTSDYRSQILESALTPDRQSREVATSISFPYNANLNLLTVSPTASRSPLPHKTRNKIRSSSPKMNMSVMSSKDESEMNLPHKSSVESHKRRHSSRLKHQRSISGDLTKNDSKRSRFSHPIRCELMRYRPIVKGDSVCGEVLVHALKGSRPINDGSSSPTNKKHLKCMQRALGTNDLLLSKSKKDKKLNWGCCYAVLDPGPELLVCYSHRKASRTIKTIRLIGASVKYLGRNMGNTTSGVRDSAEMPSSSSKATSNAPVTLYCWQIKEAQSSATNRLNTSMIFGAPSQKIATLWAQALRFTITQRKERESLLEERKRKREAVSQALRTSPLRFQSRTDKYTETAKKQYLAWNMPARTVRNALLHTHDGIGQQSPSNQIAAQHLEISPLQKDTTGESTAAFLQEMGFAVVPDVYKGRIIGLTLGNPKDEAASIIQAFIRGALLRVRFAKKRGKRGKFVRARSSYHRALKSKTQNVVPLEARHLRPRKPYVMSSHMERLYAFAPRTAANAARRIQTLVRGLVARHEFLLIFKTSRDAACAIQGFVRMCNKRWRKKCERAATIINTNARRKLAYLRLARLRIDAYRFVHDYLVLEYLWSSIIDTYSIRFVERYLRMQISMMRLKHAKRAASTISKFWRHCVGKALRRQFRIAVRAVIRLQASTRTIFQMKKYKDELGPVLDAVHVISVWWRSHEPRLAARKIQSTWRMYLGAKPFKAAKWACLVISSRYRGWNIARKFDRKLAAALVIENQVRIMVAKRQAELRVWQIVKIQNRFRARAARAKFEILIKTNAVLFIQAWYRECLERSVFAERLAAQKLISKWWVGIQFLDKLEKVRIVSRCAAILLQACVRRFLARLGELKRVASQRETFFILQQRNLYTQAYYVSGRRITMSSPSVSSSSANGRFLASGVFRPREFRFDTQIICNNTSSSTRALDKMSFVMPLRDLSLTVLLHPWLRRRSFSVDEFVTAIASVSFSMLATFHSHGKFDKGLPCIKQIESTSKTDELSRKRQRNHNFNCGVVIGDGKVALMSGLEEYSVRMPLTVATSIKRVIEATGRVLSTQTLSVHDIVSCLTGSETKLRGGYVSRSLAQNGARAFLSQCFKTNLPDIHVDRLVSALQLAQDPDLRSRLNAFLERVSQRFQKSYGSVYLRMLSAGEGILLKLKRLAPGQGNRYSYAARVRRIVKAFSSMQLEKARSLDSSLLVSARAVKSTNDPCARTDAGALFVVKLVLMFLDLFLEVHADLSNRGRKISARCKTLHNYAVVLLQGIPARYCSGDRTTRKPIAMLQASSVLNLNSILGHNQMDRETFIPAIVQAIDFVARLSGLGIVLEDENDEKREKNRIKAKAKAREARAKIFRMQHSPHDNYSDTDSSISDDENSILRRPSSHLEDSGAELNDIEQLFPIIEFEQIAMAQHMRNLQSFINPVDVFRLRSMLINCIPGGLLSVADQNKAMKANILLRMNREEEEVSQAVTQAKDSAMQFLNSTDGRTMLRDMATNIELQLRRASPNTDLGYIGKECRAKARHQFMQRTILEARSRSRRKIIMARRLNDSVGVRGSFSTYSEVSLEEKAWLNSISHCSTSLKAEIGLSMQGRSMPTRMIDVISSWAEEATSRLQEYPYMDIIPGLVTGSHVLIELWEETTQCTDSLPKLKPSREIGSTSKIDKKADDDADITIYEEARAHLVYMWSLLKLIKRIGKDMPTLIADFHKSHYEAQERRCLDYMRWVKNERTRCAAACKTSSKHAKKCNDDHAIAVKLDKLAGDCSLIGEKERPDKADKCRLAYRKSNVDTTKVMCEAAQIELTELEKMLEAINSSNDDCAEVLTVVHNNSNKTEMWQAEAFRMQANTISQLNKLFRNAQKTCRILHDTDGDIAEVDRQQFILALKRDLSGFDIGESTRVQLQQDFEVKIHSLRATARYYRKTVRQYVVHLWRALERKSSWFSAFEEDFSVRLEEPCVEVEKRIASLYDQCKEAKDKCEKMVNKMRTISDGLKVVWHECEEADVKNFWWFPYIESQCKWYWKWREWRQVIRLEKKVFEDRRREEARVAKEEVAVIEAAAAAVPRFKIHDVVEAKCKGWKEWWIGQIRRVVDTDPGSGKFTYFIKFQDGERIRGVEQRRIRETTNKVPENYTLIDDTGHASEGATSDYTNDSLGDPESDESLFYWQTDSDIPPSGVDEDEHTAEREERAKAKQKAKDKKKVKKNSAKKKLHGEELKKKKEIAKMRRRAERAANKKRGQALGVLGDDEASSDESDADVESDAEIQPSSSADSDTVSEQSELDPLQHVLDRAIEFKSLFPNSEIQDIPWEKIFDEERVQWNPFEAQRLEDRYDWRHNCYFPVAKNEVKKTAEELEEEALAAAKLALEEDPSEAYPPLVLASHRGQVEKVKLIIEAGADIEMEAENDGETALLAACRHGHFKLVLYLLECGAKVNHAKKSSGEMPAMVASQRGYEEVVDALYEAGAKHVPRPKQKLKFYGHRKVNDIVISETESDRSSDRHSWDLDADHPLDFENMFQPVSKRRQEKKDKRRKEKIASRMKDHPLTSQERQELIFSSARRTARFDWDAVENLLVSLCKESALPLRLAFIEGETQTQIWNAEVRKHVPNPVSQLPKKYRLYMIKALEQMHRTRLAVSWRDISAALNSADSMIEFLEKGANLPLKEGRGVLGFQSRMTSKEESDNQSRINTMVLGNVKTPITVVDGKIVSHAAEFESNLEPDAKSQKFADWGDLSADHQSQLGQICSDTPKIVRILKKIKQSHDAGVLECLKEEDRLIDVGKPTDNTLAPIHMLEDANQLRRLAKFFDRDATLPVVDKKQLQEAAKKAKEQARLDKERGNAALALDKNSNENGNEEQNKPAGINGEVHSSIGKRKRKSELEAEMKEALKLAARSDKVLELNECIKAHSQYLKIDLTKERGITKSVYRLHLLTRYGSPRVTWNQYVDVAIRDPGSRFQVRKAYHKKRLLLRGAKLRSRFRSWASKLKAHVYVKYGKKIPFLHFIVERGAATRIQNWWRCLSTYWGFLKQRYAFDQCKKVQEAAICIQNMFWRKKGFLELRQKVSNDFVKVWDPESKGTFYVDLTTMGGRMHIPSVTVNCLSEYSEKACFKEQVILRAIRPKELTYKAEKLKHKLLVKQAAAMVQTKYLEPSWRGSILLPEDVHGIIREAIQSSNEKKRKKNHPESEMLPENEKFQVEIITLLCLAGVLYEAVDGGVKFRVEAEHREPIWEADN